jgi:addiction module HigA family antidote
MKIKATHPGKILKKKFLEENEVSAYRLSMEIGISQMTISRIVRGERGITPEMAVRLAKFLNTTPQFWLEMQNEYDIEVAKYELKEELKNIKKLG